MKVFDDESVHTLSCIGQVSHLGSCPQAFGVHSVRSLASCLHHWSDLHPEDSLPHLWHPCWRRTRHVSPAPKPKSTPAKSHVIAVVQHIALCAVTGNHGAVVHWSRWRSLLILVVATVLTSACADLVTENIQPILNQPNVSQVNTRLWACADSFESVVSWKNTNVRIWLLQYFIGVTVLAMVPEIPEIVNGIQFALYNNISLR